MPETVFERRPAPATVVERSLRETEHAVFWLDDRPPARFPELRRDTTADLAIVGGGYMGLWTAVMAKEENPDRDVLLLEGGLVGHAASGRNGGFCEVSLTHGYGNGASRWPDEIDLLEELGEENIAGILATIDRYDMDVDLHQSGLLKVATEDYQVPQLASRAADDENVFLDAEEVRTHVNSPTYLAGFWDKRANLLVHPAKLTAELARVASEIGVRIHDSTPVRKLDSDASGVHLTCDAASVRAAQVVLATNVFPSLLKRNALMTVPVYDYVLATEPLSSAQWEAVGWQNFQGISDMANQFHYYRPTDDGRIVFGGYDAIYFSGGRIRSRYENRAATHRKLASHFFTTFPQLAGLEFTHRWGGVIDTCTRFCAFYGTAHNGRVAYAAGFTGLGVAATRFAGKVVLDLLAGRRTKATELEMVRKKPLPFPPEPLASIGINATRWSLDRADHREGRRNVLLRTLDRLGLGFDS